jgi:hypothetical protein
MSNEISPQIPAKRQKIEGEKSLRLKRSSGRSTKGF